MIAGALRRFEALKPAYAAQVQAAGRWRAVHAQDSAAQVVQARALGLYERSLTQTQLLHQDATAKYQAAQDKTRRRGWLVAIEAAGLVLAGYVMLTK